MKNLKRLFAPAFALCALMVGGVFVSCSDNTEEDDELVVTISNTSDLIVSIIAPADYDGKDVSIVYTDDGSTPNVEATVDASETTGYKTTITGTNYEGPFQSTAGKTIKACGYYYNETSKKIALGPVQTYTVKEVQTTETTATDNVNDATGASSGDFTFKLASSGNTNSIHYFDTASSNVFKLNDNYPKVYYQIQFSWRGTNKGNWYLYMRQVGGNVIQAAGSSTTYLAKGSYTGHVFDKSSTDCEAGEVTLIDSNGETKGKITIDSDKKFSLKIENSDAATGTVGTFTVSSDAK